MLFVCHDYNTLICRLYIHLKKVKFELRMCKKNACQYSYYILAVENITFSCLGPSSRVSTNGIVANYVLFNFSRTIQHLYAMVYEIIISTTCRNVSKTYGAYVNFSDVASAVNVLSISILYSDIQIPMQQLDAVFPKDILFYRLFRDHNSCRCVAWRA